MAEINFNIEIGNYRSRFCAGFECKHTWDRLTQEATLKLPDLGSQLDKKLKAGDPVKVDLGYDDKLKTEFEGYVRDIKPNYPFELQLEDEMYMLKRNPVTKSWRQVQLREVVQFLVPDADIQVPEVTLKPFKIEEQTPAQALQKLKKTYGLAVYFRNKRLFVGLPYTEPGMQTVKYHFQKNLPLDQDVKFKRAEDMKIKVKAISINSDNKKLEVTKGDEDGQVRTLHFYNKTEAELNKLAEQKIDTLKVDGYEGTIRTKHRPYSEHSWTADIINDQHPDKESSNLIDAVTVSYDPGSGIERKNELGPNADI